MHQRAQRLGDLRRPDRVGVDLPRAVKITAEVLAAQLMEVVPGLVELEVAVPRLSPAVR
jgi:acyl-CoA synthetase (AMP-forming)/AMP-acid ligase II